MQAELIYDPNFHAHPELILPRALSDAECEAFEARFPDCDYFEDLDGEAYWIAASHELDLPPLNDWLASIEA